MKGKMKKLPKPKREGLMITVSLPDRKLNFFYEKFLKYQEFIKELKKIDKGRTGTGTG